MPFRDLVAVLLAALLAAGPVLAQQSLPTPSAGPLCPVKVPDLDPRRSIFVT